MTTLTQLPSPKVPLSDTQSGLITTQWYRYFFNLYTLTNSAGVVVNVTASSPLLSSGGISPNISIPPATSSQGGYLTATDWVNFNSKQPAGSYLTAVTGTSPVVSSGGTTPAISMPAASTSVSGYLTSTDWNTFNSKGSGSVTNVTGTAPVSVATGTTTPVISLASGYGDTQNPYASKTANYVLAAPNGSAGVPTFRALVSGDVTGLGTMSTQNANAVAITGGTINGTVIGGTTPAAGTFTTITGQTEVLKGTGSNLVLQSGWAGGTSGTVGSGAVAPTSWVFLNTGGTVTYASALSGSGNSIRFVATASERPGLQQSVSLFAGMVYSAFFTVEAVNGGSPTLNQLFVTTGTTTSQIYYVNGVLATAGTVATAGTKVQVVTTILTVVGTTTARYGLGVNSAIAGDITIANPQLEIGSTLNTYIPTTTTAIYGTPTLSFSGVAGLGLESNGALYVSPAGTGALQAQATTSTATGGNVRGANAVDWQTIRGNANQVASGAYAVLGGGNQNRNTGFGGCLAGGEYCVVTGTDATVTGGNSNQATGSRSTVVGGGQNLATGYYNFIGGGQSNSGTANAAVTTQSGTMNATTAVTLSGSNASIKVGQFITGTSIADNTYVAAISGTSLTLSQAASGSSTSTLSFFTPHGVVVGGGNNQATGSYSFIGGGGDAGTAANRNVASGDWSFVGGGFKNTASGILSSVAGGHGNTASGISSFVGGGGTFGGVTSLAPNTASGLSSVVTGGWNNTASGTASGVLSGAESQATAAYSSVIGGIYGTTRSIVGNTVATACANPIQALRGASQSALLVLGVQTTDATATALRSDTNAASGTNQVILPNNSAYFFRGEVVSGVTGGGDTKGWTIEGVIKRGAGVGTTTLVGSTVTSLYADAGAATWTIALAADTTNGGLRVTFTGQASTTIRTVCSIRSTEMTY